MPHISFATINCFCQKRTIENGMRCSARGYARCVRRIRMAKQAAGRRSLEASTKRTPCSCEKKCAWPGITAKSLCLCVADRYTTHTTHSMRQIAKYVSLACAAPQQTRLYHSTVIVVVVVADVVERSPRHDEAQRAHRRERTHDSIWPV